MKIFSNSAYFLYVEHYSGRFAITETPFVDQDVLIIQSSSISKDATIMLDSIQNSETSNEEKIQIGISKAHILSSGSVKAGRFEISDMESASIEEDIIRNLPNSRERSYEDVPNEVKRFIPYRSPKLLISSSSDMSMEKEAIESLCKPQKLNSQEVLAHLKVLQPYNLMVS